MFEEITEENVKQIMNTRKRCMTTSCMIAEKRCLKHAIDTKVEDSALAEILNAIVDKLYRNL